MYKKHTLLLAAPVALVLVGVFVVRRYQEVPWEEFQAAAAGTTRITVVDHGQSRTMNQVLYEEADPAVISDFIAKMVIKRSSPGACSCAGSLRFEFWCENRLLLKMTLHHGQSFRWDKSKLDGDALLSRASRRFVMEWLAERNIVPGDITRR